MNLRILAPKLINSTETSNEMAFPRLIEIQAEYPSDQTREFRLNPTEPVYRELQTALNTEAM